MTMIKKTLTAGFATLALAGAMTMSASNEAEARWRRGHAGGAIAAGVIGGLALGAIAASAAQPRVVGSCYTVRRTVWDDFRGHYVTRRVRVCE